MSQHADEWLTAKTRVLAGAGVPSARLDCLILLEDATDRDRSWLLAHPEYVLKDSLLSSLDVKVAQRAAHEPLAYIRQRTEFYGREFYVDARVLEPRPESETMIELLKTLTLPDRPVIVDVGTGSGALAVTIRLELPVTTVIGTDIDPECLVVAQRNAKSLQADIRFLQADLLNVFGHEERIDAIVANLPYVPDSYTINQAAMNEPRLAIFGGPDGLDLYRRLFGQIRKSSLKPAYVLAESLPPQHAGLTEIAKESGYELLREQDFIQVFSRRQPART